MEPRKVCPKFFRNRPRWNGRMETGNCEAERKERIQNPPGHQNQNRPRHLGPMPPGHDPDWHLPPQYHRHSLRIE